MTTAKSDSAQQPLGTQSIDLLEARDSLAKSLDDVKVLLSFHEKAELPVKGRPSKDHSTLKRAAIVLLYAGWESFFENLIEAVAHVHATKGTLATIPESLQIVLLRDIQRLANTRPDSAKKTPSDVLKSVIDFDWPTRLRELAHDELYGRADAEQASYGVNSADVQNVNRLLGKYCGDDLFDRVAWAGMSNRQVAAKLNKLVELRGSIAHTGRLPDETPLTLAAVRNYVDFVEKVADKLIPEVALTLALHTTAPEVS